MIRKYARRGHHRQQPGWTGFVLAATAYVGAWTALSAYAVALV